MKYCQLGLFLRQTNNRTRPFVGPDDVQVHWGTNALSNVALMEKNLFSPFVHGPVTEDTSD